MENKEFIQVLKLQEQKVAGQLQAIRSIIQMMGGDSAEFVGPIIASGGSSGTFVPPAGSDEKERFYPDLDAKPEIKGNHLIPVPIRGKRTRSIVIPKEYDATLSYTKKIAYLLKTEGAMSSVQIVDRISELEPDVEKIKIERSVTIGASNMYRKGLVRANREGRRYIYSIQ